MQIGTITHGFRLDRIRKLEELQGELFEMEHEKTGARLCWLKQPEENKAFSIAFRTIPEDSTGVFHILEHSVLCGSEKYPVKKPFVELMKTSLKTFLNAMTFPDKTVYPVASRNDRDFLNLMDVYLDAVFHPAIYHTPEIFRQEGWHYEFGGGEPVCQGVVLNEMRGSFGSPATLLENALNRALFPDSCYRHVYGGDPAHIPELHYEQFLASHRKFYHPSNARISLVGDVPLEQALEKLDGFLSAYERRDCCFPIPIQAAVEARTEEIPYEIGPGEPEAGRAVASFGKLLCRFDDCKRRFAASVLADYLTGDQDSVLKKAIVEAGLGQDVALRVHDGTQQSWISLDVWNTDREKLPELRSTVEDTVRRLLERGLDRRRLRACFNRFSFRMRDRDGGWIPRSVRLALGMLDSWLYDGDPAAGILTDDALGAVEAELETAYFPSLLQELLLDDRHTATVLLIPSHSFGKERDARETARLQTEKASWSAETAQELEAQAQALARWQQTPDSPEAAATVPVLRRSDLRQAPEALLCHAGRMNGVPVLRHATKGALARLNLLFDASDLAFDELPVLALLATVLGSLGTKRHSGAELQLRIKESIGRLELRAVPQPGNDAAHCRVLLRTAVTALPAQADAAAELLTELLAETVFTDRALLRDNLRKKAMEAQMALYANGHSFAMCRIGAYQSAFGAVRDQVSGLSYVLWLKRHSEAEDGTLDGLLEKMNALVKRIVRTGRLTVSCAETVPDALIQSLLSRLPALDETVTEACCNDLLEGSEGVVIPAAVGYAAKGGSLQNMQVPYHGSLPVLANILNYEYLWPQIRVGGGAYGCGFLSQDSGDFGFYTYRDPQPGRSLDVMDCAGAFLEEYCAANPDLTRYIFGAVSELDPLRTDAEKMETAENRYFRGETEELIRARYQQLIHTGTGNLLELKKLLDATAASCSACVIAGEALLDACGERLNKRITV